MPHTITAAVLLACASAIGCAGSLRLPARSDDAGLTSLIARRLAADPRLCPFDITVVVYAGTARLEGKVSGDPEKRRAEQLAREAGATRVEDLLRIDPTTGDSGKC